jgi:hypothetical protein
MFEFMTRIAAGLACLLTAVYVFSCPRKRVGHMLLASGLFLIGLDSIFFNLYAVYMTHFVRETRCVQSTAWIAPAVSAAVTIIHWTLILTGIILVCRRTAGE